MHSAKVNSWKKWTGLWRLKAFLDMYSVSIFFEDDEVWLENVQYSHKFLSTDKNMMDFMRACNRLKVYDGHKSKTLT